MSGADPGASNKYLDISNKYLDICTIHCVCFSVCVEWERVSGFLGVGFTREGKVRENVAVNYRETRNI